MQCLRVFRLFCSTFIQMLSLKYIVYRFLFILGAWIRIRMEWLRFYLEEQNLQFFSKGDYIVGFLRNCPHQGGPLAKLLQLAFTTDSLSSASHDKCGISSGQGSIQGQFKCNFKLNCGKKRNKRHSHLPMCSPFLFLPFYSSSAHSCRNRQK